MGYVAETQQNARSSQNYVLGVQHDGRLPFWKPASVFAYYVCIVIAFVLGEINILLLLLRGHRYGVLIKGKGIVSQRRVRGKREGRWLYVSRWGYW